MPNEQNDKLDEWEQKLEIELVKLKQCQNTKQLDSCSKCPEFFECEIRKLYIKSVYESMNKGSTGGFEF